MPLSTCGIAQFSSGHVNTLIATCSLRFAEMMEKKEGAGLGGMWGGG